MTLLQLEISAGAESDPIAGAALITHEADTTAHNIPGQITAAIAAKADLVGGLVPASQLGSGTRDGTRFLRDDNTWTIVGTGSGSPTGAAGGSLGGTYPNPTIAAGAVGSNEINAAIKDPAAATPGLRSIGSGAQQTIAGNDVRLTNARTPLPHTHPNTEVTGLGTASVLDAPASGDASTTQLVKGTDTRLTNSRAPTAHTHPISDVTSLQTTLNAKADLVGGKVPSSQLPSSTSSAPNAINPVGGNFGASQSLALTPGTPQWLGPGILNANCVVTISGTFKASEFRITGTQPATPHTLTVYDGTNSYSVNVPMIANAAFDVWAYSVDGSNFRFIVMSSATSNGPFFKVLTTNGASVNNSSTLVDISGLDVPLSGSPTEILIIKWYFRVQENGIAGDIKFGFTGPSGATMDYGSGATSNNNLAGWGAAAIGNTATPLNPITATQQAGSGTGKVGYKWEAHAFGGGTAGSIQPQFAQLTVPNTETLTILAGSHVEYTRLQS